MRVHANKASPNLLTAVVLSAPSDETTTPLEPRRAHTALDPHDDLLAQADVMRIYLTTPVLFGLTSIPPQMSSVETRADSQEGSLHLVP